MTIEIPISAETEARLREQAKAAGQDITTFIREALEEKLSADVATENGQEEVPANKWIAELREWIASHRPLPYEADDSRESTCEGCAE